MKNLFNYYSYLLLFSTFTILTLISCVKEKVDPVSTSKKSFYVRSRDLSPLDATATSMSIGTISLDGKIFGVEDAPFGCSSSDFIEIKGETVTYFFYIKHNNGTRPDDKCEGTFPTSLLDIRCNEISIVNFNNSATLKVNGTLATPSDTDSRGAENEYFGTWVRLIGASGDRTDLAIGGISGAPDNRVYMCEKKGSTAAGLYKGYLNGNIITWDEEHGIPDFTVELNGTELILDCGPCLPTTYVSGSWSGECGSL